MSYNIENPDEFSCQNENYYTNIDEIESDSTNFTNFWMKPTPPKVSSSMTVKKCSQTSEDAHLSALALTRLLQGSAEEVLAFLSAEQLIELGRNVRKLKRLASYSSSSSQKKRSFNSTLTNIPVPPHSDRLQDVILEPKEEFHSDCHRLWMMLNAVADGTTSVATDKDTTLLRFTYSSRGILQEYCIRTDIDKISSETLPEPFRLKNCVYPRAMGDRIQYTGNRYEYETTVNDIAWRLTWINLDILAGKRGLIQRAVDSYRNRFNVSRSRRVVRQEKLLNGTLRRRSESCCPGSLPISVSMASHHSQYHSQSIISSYNNSNNSDNDKLYPKSDTTWGDMPSSTSTNLSNNHRSDMPVDSIFITNISYYENTGRQVVLKIRLDVDFVDYQLVSKEEDKNSTPLTALKDELGNLIIKLNSPILPSNPSALRGAIDAFKYKILTCDPTHFAPDTSHRLRILIQRFGSLLAPLPPKHKSTTTLHSSKSGEELDVQDGLDLFASHIDESSISKSVSD